MGWQLSAENRATAAGAENIILRIDMTDGLGCKCMANCQADCVCDVDWTPKELVAARERIAELGWQIEKLMRGEFICTKCGLRKDSEAGQANF